ncbi:hypothetical protein CAP35_02055 [Chitinophagaceae bacterium IBVUCB1]|nr:hypothetical protein CAP35_02055 [Chitinophagaceae bacterium IBVUCB1]
MVKIKLPTEVYDKLYHMLVLKVKTKLGGAVLTATDAQLWEAFERSKYYRDLFRSQKFKPNHIYRKLEQRGNPKHLISFDRDLFCDALQFLGYKIPTKKTDLDYTYTERLNEWGTKFLKKYFSQQPDYIDIVVNYSWRTKSTDIGADLDYSVGRYRNLDNKVYLTEYRQGQLIDRAVLRFKTEGNSVIGGVFEVLYQNPDLSYKTVTEKLVISGWFNYNSILILRYKNADQFKEHAGVFLFELNTEADKITGTYVAHYEDMPPIRESRIGTMTLAICNDENQAQKFIDEWKGKPAPKDADKIIKNWETKFKLADSIKNKFATWLREDKPDKELDIIISQLTTK